MSRIWLGAKQVRKLAESNVTENQAHVAPHVTCSCGAPMTCSAAQSKKILALEAELVQKDREIDSLVEPLE